MSCALLRPHLGGGVLDGAHHLVIPGAAAEVARDPIADLGLGRIEVAVEQRLRGDQQARRAEAALQRRVLQELLLYGMQLAAGGEALDGLDRVPFGLDGEHQARAHETPVQDHAAGAAVAGAAAFLAPGEVELVAEHVEQGLLRLAEEIGLLAVDDGGNVGSAHRWAPARSKAMAAARRASTPATLIR